VLEQSPDVTAFLSSQNFQAKNGMNIGISEYPEFKMSKNTIFLRGSNKGNDFKPDVTMFTGNMQRDNQYDMVVDAIQDLVNTVKKAVMPTPVHYGYGTNYGNPYGNVLNSGVCAPYAYTTVKAHKRRVCNHMPNAPMFAVRF